MWKQIFNKSAVIEGDSSSPSAEFQFSSESIASSTSSVTPSRRDSTKAGGNESTQHSSPAKPMFSSLRSSGRMPNDTVALAEVEMERKVSAAASRLGRDIQDIITAAKTGSQFEDKKTKSNAEYEDDAWKVRLLQILGGTDIDVELAYNPHAKSDIDTLLQNSCCEKFVLKCMENELPPNLIHCLRLLRVLELQAAHSYVKLKRKTNNCVSKSATEKVSQLLCLLCTDLSLGEQLRPHLFGLLALPGAGYPTNGVHIAKAAADVVMAVSKSCLSSSLIWFLHDRKLIVHMTDDVKELCGLTDVSNETSSSLCLYSEHAEVAGLWVVALRTIIHLVHSSCNLRCVELLRDFQDAGGYNLLSYAILKSKSANVKKLLELVTTLTSCNIDNGLAREESLSGSSFFNDFTKPAANEKVVVDYGLASNPNAFELIDDLMSRSIPFLVKYADEHNGLRPPLRKGGPLRELVKLSVDMSLESCPHSTDNDKSHLFELANEVLIVVLQLYSDHPRNYSIIEERFNVLSLYLLSFPTFPDISIKVTVLKTLEYICTGLSDVNRTLPLRITCEMLLTLCKTQLRTLVKSQETQKNETIAKNMNIDASLLCNTIEKLALDDSLVRDILIGVGIFDEQVDEFLSLVIASFSVVQLNKNKGTHIPPLATLSDDAFIIMCRLLNIALKRTIPMTNAKSTAVKVTDTSFAAKRSHDLNLFITHVIQELGTSSAEMALNVLESKIVAAGRDQIQTDMECFIKISAHFSDLITEAYDTGKSLCDVDFCTVLTRQCITLESLTSLLSKGQIYQLTFRACLGLEAIVNAVRSLFRIADRYTNDQNDTDSNIVSLSLRLIKNCFELLSVANQCIIMVRGNLIRDTLRETGAYNPISSSLLSQGRILYDELAERCAATGMLSFRSFAEYVVKCALHVIDPSLCLSIPQDDTSHPFQSTNDGLNSTLMSIRNPEAALLALGIATRLESDIELALHIIQTIMELCLPRTISSTHNQMASSGLCQMLLSSKRYMSILSDCDHKLYCSLRQLLKVIAVVSISHSEFILLLRHLLGWGNLADGEKLNKWKTFKRSLSSSKAKSGSSDERGAITSGKGERQLCENLELLCEIAEKGDRVASISLGGSSLSSIALFIQKGRLEERLQLFAREGSIRFVQLDTIDALSNTSQSVPSLQSISSSRSGTENLWYPMSTSGFTFSAWFRVPSTSTPADGNIFLIDLATLLDDDGQRSTTRSHYEYISFYYDVKRECFCLLASSSPKPVSFPRSILTKDTWHHVLLTIQPPKRSMLSKKCVIGVCVDGNPLETELKADSVMLPPTLRITIGVPNPAVIISGIISGSLPLWELGPTVLFSTILGPRDATSIYFSGPDFEGPFWGDRPQRLSLSACATVSFGTFANVNGDGTVLDVLEQRGISDLESSSHPSMENRYLGAYYVDSLDSMGLLCQVNPDLVLAAFGASSHVIFSLSEVRLKNIAKINSTNASITTDAVVYGIGSVNVPQTFADNVRWAGGPNILFPVVQSASSKDALILSLRLIRASSFRHIPNVEAMQVGGGYRMLASLLKEKNHMDIRVIDECFRFAVDGFFRQSSAESIDKQSLRWLVVDLDAAKQLLLNHQIWDLHSGGPNLPLHLISRLSLLLSPGELNTPFNARRLHQLGIVPFTLNLMLEAAKLYSLGFQGAEELNKTDPKNQAMGASISAFRNGWFVEPPASITVSAGGDPGNPLLFSCKNLLRRVLMYMFTPLNLEAIAGSAVYTLSIDSSQLSPDFRSDLSKSFMDRENELTLLPGSVTRVYFLRVLEELIVERIDVRTSREIPDAPKEEQTHAFLSAFAGILKPIWFMTLLDRCRDVASGSVVFRLLIIMLQKSPSFIEAFIKDNGFHALYKIIPKFSTAPSIILNVLGLLFHAPVWHLPCFATLNASQLSDIFDTECDNPALLKTDSTTFSKDFPLSTGGFILLLECVTRNISLSAFDDDVGLNAVNTNDAVLSVIERCQMRSPSFKELSRNASFFEPLIQAICASIRVTLRISCSLHDQANITENSALSSDITAVQRFRGDETLMLRLFGNGRTKEFRLIYILRHVILDTVLSKPLVAPTLFSMFHFSPLLSAPDEIELFQSVLIENCGSVIQEVLRNINQIGLNNIVGICSVFLDRLMTGNSSSEDVLECVKHALCVLEALTTAGTKAAVLAASDPNSSIVMDAVHISRLICLAALQRCRSISSIDQKETMLEPKLLLCIAMNAACLLTPSLNPSTTISKRPSVDALSHQMWMSASLGRCRHSSVKVSYPDIASVEEPDRAFVVALLAYVNLILQDQTNPARDSALQIVMTLMAERRSLMADLLRKEVRRSESRVETIDLMNRGGFGALLARIDSSQLKFDKTVPQMLNVAFFDWFDRNQSQVVPIFDAIRAEAISRFPFFDFSAIPRAASSENDPKPMMVNTHVPVPMKENLLCEEIADFLQQVNEKSLENMSIWRRSGFSDLAFGRFLWEKIEMQQNEIFSLWSGDLISAEGCHSSDGGKGNSTGSRDTNRLKLDLSEGYERQRRRFLPNYEFEIVYNIVDNHQVTDSETASTGNSDGNLYSQNISQVTTGSNPVLELSVDGTIEATTAILKEMHISKVYKKEDDCDVESDLSCPIEEVKDFDVDQSMHKKTLSSQSVTEDLPGTSHTEIISTDNIDGSVATEEISVEMQHLDGDSIVASSLDLVVGFLVNGDKPERVYNVKRCVGLEVRKAILLWCARAIYIIDGFEKVDGEGLQGRIIRVEHFSTIFNINLRAPDRLYSDLEQHQGTVFSNTESDRNRNSGGGVKKKSRISEESSFRHRSQRISFDNVHCIYRRRYQLQQNALEFYDVHRSATLVAFEDQDHREDVLSRTLAARLPHSIFNSSLLGTTIGLGYNKVMNSFRNKVTNQWVNGQISNFDFIMHLNTFAGRSYHDLTQYPVFPWVLADYESETIDLDDPKVYRDLSKPMGAIGEVRAKQFKDRYEALEIHYLEQDEEQPPPFHYGTHYSCAAYVVSYLIRLEPFSRQALILQGGKFDLADRLFQNVAASWRSASRDNLQDVRELIPEFYYLPDFLVNKNSFDFGVTQHGKVVNHVVLPPWAKGDPSRFIRIQRKALESEYVSRNLHKWVDLVFGYKQRGREAIAALNTFVHVTYEGAVDLDAIADPVQRESTIAQIHNFGQTPSRLEKVPFPPRNVMGILKDKSIDMNALPYLSHLTPSFCIVGAPHKVYMRTPLCDIIKLGLTGQDDKVAGDVYHSKGAIVGVAKNCTFFSLSTYIKYGGPNHGISFHVAHASARYREVDKVLSIHDGMHRYPITVATLSPDTQFLVTCCLDSIVRLWEIRSNHRGYERSYDLRLKGSLFGHEGVKINCIDICTIFGTIVTGDANGVILQWNVRTLSILRRLRYDGSRSSFTTAVSSSTTEPVISVSLNHKNGNIVTLVGSCLTVFDINGNPVAIQPPGIKFLQNNMPTCAVSTNCPEWMDGVVAVTGHMNGDVRMWGIDYDRGILVFRHVIPDKVHDNPISCIRCLDNQKALLIGDTSGKISMSSTLQLDSMSQSDLAVLAEELRRLTAIEGGYKKES